MFILAQIFRAQVLSGRRQFLSDVIFHRVHPALFFSTVHQKGT
jgi:hypothetical protein